jgi:putative ABC transport system substrate-binding protein
MTRRPIGLLVTLALGLLVAPLAAEAQPAGKVYRVGILAPGFPPSDAERQRGPFRQMLRELGWVVGQNLVLEERWAEGQYDRLPEFAGELVRLPVDVITTAGTLATAAAKQATSAIPIVMFSGGDPVSNGFVASLARPGGNITGTAFAPPEIAGKILQVLTEVMPNARRVAVIFNPVTFGVSAYASAPLKENEVAARALGLTLQPVEVRQPSDLDSAFVTITQDRPDALYVARDPVVSTHQMRILDFAARNKLPAIYTARWFVVAGGLMSYGPDMRGVSRRTAVFVDKILKGAKPADLPIEQPMKFELVINLKTAQALGLTIPPTVLFQADEIIR